MLGDATAEVFRATAERYLALGFRDFKVKLSGDLDRDRAKLDALRARPDIRVRGDANNLWDDAAEAIEGIAALDFPFFALEEPIAANQYAELAEVGEALDTRIVLDESFLRIDQLALLTGQPRRWIVNVRVSKMGGLLRSLAIVDRARSADVGHHRGRAGRRDEPPDAGGTDRGEGGRRRARRPGRRVRHIPAGTGHLRAAADVRPRRRARLVGARTARRAPAGVVTALALWVLLGLFLLRVVGQALLGLGVLQAGGVLPPWHEWYSGLLPYPWLLVSQIAILAVLAKASLDVTRGDGYFARPNRRLGRGLLVFGARVRARDGGSVSAARQPVDPHRVSLGAGRLPARPRRVSPAADGAWYPARSS